MGYGHPGFGIHLSGIHKLPPKVVHMCVIYYFRRDFMYPAKVDAKTRMTITNEDMERLRQGGLLNDTLVDFSMR